MFNSKERAVLFGGLAQAMAIAQYFQGSRIARSFRKADERRSPVTAVDMAVQVMIVTLLRELFPGVQIRAEEAAQEIRRIPLLGEATLKILNIWCESTGRNKIDLYSLCQLLDSTRWVSNSTYFVVDPKDGTEGYLQKAEFTSQGGLIENGELKFAFLCSPRLPGHQFEFLHHRKIFWAEKGMGAFWQYVGSEQQVRLIAAAHHNDTNIRVLRSIRRQVDNVRLEDAVAASLGASPIVVHSGIKYPLVTAVEPSLFISLPRVSWRVMNVWDHCPALFVSEAGGTVTDMHGEQLDFSTGDQLTANRGIVAASSSELHRSAISLIQKLGLPSASSSAIAV